LRDILEDPLKLEINEKTMKRYGRRQETRVNLVNKQQQQWFHTEIEHRTLLARFVVTVIRG
jgi:hypothetical protein